MKTPTNKDNLDQLFNKAKADKQNLDDFEKEAMAGFDMLNSEKEAIDLKADLDARINKELFYKKEKQPFSKKPNLTQQRIDAILDKINQQGYHSLTAEEKELLNKASKEEL